MKKSQNAAKKGAERRKFERKNVLETFQVFLVIPNVGLRKIHLRDVAKGGLSFMAEKADAFTRGSAIDAFFYINLTLRLPLQLRVANLFEGDEGQRVGCEFAETSSKAYKSYMKFLELLDELSEFMV